MRAVLIFIVAATLTASIASARGGSCQGDVTNDGVTDVLDLLQVLGDWGCVGTCASDTNGDDFVDVQDLLNVLGDWGCEAPLTPETTLSGTVTNLLTSDPVVGANVTVGAELLVTDALGGYSGEFPVGQYTVGFEADNFIMLSQPVILFPGVPAVLNAALEPVGPVIVNIIISGDPDLGATIDATAMVEVYDGSTISGYEWMQLGGTPATINGALTDMASVDLGARGDYKTHLFELLVEPPIGAEQLPPNVPVPEGEFVGGLQDRWQVVGLNPFVLEETGLVVLEVAVTTSSGTYLAEAEVHTGVPWKPSSDIRNVPIGLPVLLHGKTQASYDWQLTAPMTSLTTLTDALTQNPEFVPDIAGIYEVTVTDIAANTTRVLEIYAGTWRGMITDEDAEGRPTPDPYCMNCHGVFAPDKFTPWAQTGHAEIFTDNLDSSPYWGPQCFSCHTVGFDTEIANGGVDDAPDYGLFLGSGLIGSPGDNWSTMLVDYPAAAQLSNIQCENCHGPQNAALGMPGGAHAEGEPRLTLSSDGCATCHGEPLRHARFQQWQLSAHANYELAVDEGDSGNCSRCHTANGFLTWLPILLGTEPGDPLDDIMVAWGLDETHPQTCVTCHDPHAIGTTSGNPSNATVRISGTTPPLIAGFTAYGVGRGAICMTCHNSRRGLRNDSTFDDYYLTPEAARAPHGSAQTDLLMGENAYLVATGFRGNHSFLADSCVKCHMEETPPPDDLAYNGGGTNHTFYAALDICADCHGSGFDAPTIQGGVQDTLDILQGLVEESLLALIGDQTALGYTIDLDEGDAQITDVADIQDLVFGEYRGRQSITVTFTDMTTVGPYRMTDVEVLDGGGVPLGQLYDFADPGLIKAGWNWALVHNDGSLGIHNPTYSYNVLSASIGALDPLLALEPPSWLDLDQPRATKN